MEEKPEPLELDSARIKEENQQQPQIIFMLNEVVRTSKDVDDLTDTSEEGRKHRKKVLRRERKRKLRKRKRARRKRKRDEDERRRILDERRRLKAEQQKESLRDYLEQQKRSYEELLLRERTRREMAWLDAETRRMMEDESRRQLEEENRLAELIKQKLLQEKQRQLTEQEKFELERDLALAKDAKEHMDYEDELAFWVRKPLSEMFRRELVGELAVFREQNEKLIKDRLKICQERLKIVMKKLEDFTKDAPKDAGKDKTKEVVQQEDADKDKKQKEKEKKLRDKEKKKLDSQKVDLRLKISQLKQYPFRMYYDRDVEDKVGPIAVSDETFKQKPQTGEDLIQSRDEVPPDQEDGGKQEDAKNALKGSLTNREDQSASKKPLKTGSQTERPSTSQEKERQILQGSQLNQEDAQNTQEDGQQNALLESQADDKDKIREKRRTRLRSRDLAKLDGIELLDQVPSASNPYPQFPITSSQFSNLFKSQQFTDQGLREKERMEKEQDKDKDKDKDKGKNAIVEDQNDNILLSTTFYEQYRPDHNLPEYYSRDQIDQIKKQINNKLSSDEENKIFYDILENGSDDLDRKRARKEIIEKRNQIRMDKKEEIRRLKEEIELKRFYKLERKKQIQQRKEQKEQKQKEREKKEKERRERRKRRAGDSDSETTETSDSFDTEVIESILDQEQEDIPDIDEADDYDEKLADISRMELNLELEMYQDEDDEDEIEKQTENDQQLLEGNPKRSPLVESFVVDEDNNQWNKENETEPNLPGQKLLLSDLVSEDEKQRIAAQAPSPLPSSDSTIQQPKHSPLYLSALQGSSITSTTSLSLSQQSSSSSSSSSSTATNVNDIYYLHDWEKKTVPEKPYDVDIEQLDSLIKDDVGFKDVFDDSTNEILCAANVVDAQLPYKVEKKSFTNMIDLIAIIERYKDALRTKKIVDVIDADEEFMSIFTNRAVVSKLDVLIDEEFIQLLMGWIGMKPAGMKLRYVYTLTLLSRKAENIPYFQKYKAHELFKYLIHHYKATTEATLAVAEAIAFTTQDEFMRQFLLKAGSYNYMIYALKTFSANDEYIARYATSYIYSILQFEQEVESICQEKMQAMVQPLMGVISVESHPTDDVLRIGIAALQKMATRDSRPNDPSLKLRKEMKSFIITSNPSSGSSSHAPSLMQPQGLAKQVSFLKPQKSTTKGQDGLKNALNAGQHKDTMHHSNINKNDNDQNINSNSQQDPSQNQSQNRSQSQQKDGEGEDQQSQQLLSQQEQPQEDQEVQAPLSLQYLDAMMDAGGPHVFLDIIRDSMDTYIDVTLNAVSILWSLAARIPFQSRDWLLFDPIQILFFVHPLFVPSEEDVRDLTESEDDSTTQAIVPISKDKPDKPGQEEEEDQEINLSPKAILFQLHNDIALYTLSALTWLCQQRPLDTLPLLGEMEGTLMLSNIVMRLPAYTQYDDRLIPLALDLLHSLVKAGYFSADIDRGKLGKELVSLINQYNHSHVNKRRVYDIERTNVITACTGIMSFLYENQFDFELFSIIPIESTSNYDKWVREREYFDPIAVQQAFDRQIAAQMRVDCCRGSMTGMNVQYNVEKLGEFMLQEANNFIVNGVSQQLAKSQTSAYMKALAQSKGSLSARRQSGQQAAQDTNISTWLDAETPRLTTLNLMYYGSRLVKFLLLKDDDVKKKMVKWDGMRVFAMILDYILGVSVIFYSERFNHRLVRTNVEKLKDPDRLATMQRNKEQAMGIQNLNKREEFRQASIALAKDALQKSRMFSAIANAAAQAVKDELNFDIMSLSGGIGTEALAPIVTINKIEMTQEEKDRIMKNAQDRGVSEEAQKWKKKDPKIRIRKHVDKDKDGQDNKPNENANQDEINGDGKDDQDKQLVKADAKKQLNFGTLKSNQNAFVLIQSIQNTLKKRQAQFIQFPNASLSEKEQKQQQNENMQEQLQLKASKKTGVAMHPLSRASVYTQDHTEKMIQQYSDQVQLQAQLQQQLQLTRSMNTLYGSMNYEQGNPDYNYDYALMNQDGSQFDERELQQYKQVMDTYQQFVGWSARRNNEGKQLKDIVFNAVNVHINQGQQVRQPGNLSARASGGLNALNQSFIQQQQQYQQSQGINQVNEAIEQETIKPIALKQQTEEREGNEFNQDISMDDEFDTDQKLNQVEQTQDQQEIQEIYKLQQQQEKQTDEAEEEQREDYPPDARSGILVIGMDLKQIRLKLTKKQIEQDRLANPIESRFISQMLLPAGLTLRQFPPIEKFRRIARRALVLSEYDFFYEDEEQNQKKTLKNTMTLRRVFGEQLKRGKDGKVITGAPKKKSKLSDQDKKKEEIAAQQTRRKPLIAIKTVTDLLNPSVQRQDNQIYQSQLLQQSQANMVKSAKFGGEPGGMQSQNALSYMSAKNKTSLDIMSDIQKGGQPLDQQYTRQGRLSAREFQRAQTGLNQNQQAQSAEGQPVAQISNASTDNTQASLPIGVHQFSMQQSESKESIGLNINDGQNMNPNNLDKSSTTNLNSNQDMSQNQYQLQTPSVSFQQASLNEYDTQDLQNTGMGFNEVQYNQFGAGPSARDIGWLSEANSGYTTLCTTCPTLALKLRTEDTIQDKVKVKEKDKEKEKQKEAKIIQTLLDVVKRYTTLSALLSTRSASMAHSGDADLTSLDKVDDIVTSGGGNCENAQQITEAALNALHHLDISEQFSDSYNKMKAAARASFPQSKLFPQKERK